MNTRIHTHAHTYIKLVDSQVDSRKGLLPSHSELSLWWNFSAAILRLCIHMIHNLVKYEMYQNDILFKIYCFVLQKHNSVPSINAWDLFTSLR